MTAAPYIHILYFVWEDHLLLEINSSTLTDILVSEDCSNLATQESRSEPDDQEVQYNS